MFGKHVSRLRRRLTSTAVATTLAAAGLVAGGAAPAHALGAGEVCMFNAPSGAPLGSNALGHVGWGFLVGGSSTWVFGATESPTWAWSSSGSWSSMIAAFTYANHTGYYTKYNCSTSANSSVGATDNLVSWYDDISQSGYNLYNNNCLTHAVAIFKTYDSGTFGGMGDGWGIGPNWYFDHLPGTAHFWSRPAYL